MNNPVALAEVWRGPFLESQHSGHAVVCGPGGAVVEAWGDPMATVLPRSSCKMIQALPLVRSGAADAFHLGTEHLALACASHNGAEIHTSRVSAWLDHIGRSSDDFRCGPQMPADIPARDGLIRAEAAPCRRHNNCSGKHTGFLTLTKHLGGDANYVDIAHPVQRACLEAFEEVTGEVSPGYGIDGCSAPNHATTLHGLARAMAHFAAAPVGSAEERLRSSMMKHPELVAGETRACTNLMRAMDGQVAVKTGAEGVFIAIIPAKKLGVALKITDGATRAAECAIAAILVKLGVLEPHHPETLKYLNAPIRNWDGLETGTLRAAPALI